jgi:iron complex outermembrane receptor protein
MRGLVLLIAASVAALAGASAAIAQPSESITVTDDVVHLLQTGDNDAALGLDKPLIETPRAVTLVSDTTIDRYGITGVNDLTAITPSAYTASYYGVEGAVSLRGTLAENYFQGFKRAENRGTYTTPLSDAAGIEILSGPPSPIYGAGKVGGLVNFLPKTVGRAMRWAARPRSPMAAIPNATPRFSSMRPSCWAMRPAACMPMARLTTATASIAASIPAISCWS